jgi:hypothetical protein
MGNSSDELKARANAVTDSNENEGFAKAVRKFILQPGHFTTAVMLIGPVTKQSP